MDVDAQAVHQENGVNEVDVSKKNPDIETNGHAKETVKNVPKSKKRRSRSRTPQSKTEDMKLLHVTLKKIENDSNDKQIPEEDAEAVKSAQKTDEEPKTEEIKADEGTPSRRSKRQKDKEDTPKIDEEVKKEKTPKKDSMPKKDESAKSEQPAKKDGTPKVEQAAKKDSPSKNEHASKKDNISKIEQNAKKDNTPKNEHATIKETTPKKTNKDKSKETNDVDNEPVEMDPLFISDEPDPELLFDENSDMESGKGSPIIHRCITRRSLTRNIPTPKTPKSLDTDLDSEKTSTSTEHLEPNLDDASDITDITNTSVKVEVGSDVTRLEYTDRNCTITDDNSYLEVSRERSLSETLRSLSARRPIRPTDDIRRRVLKNAQERSDLNLPYSSHDSVEQVHSGVKRKGRSATPEDSKKFKADSPGFNNLFFSPLASLRSKFGRTDLASSTPKLLGYRDHRNDPHFNENYENINGDDEKKSWCSVM